MSGLERLPCGCRMGTVGEAFVMEPCSLNCRYYRYAIDETRRQGKPVRAIIDPDVDGDQST